MKKLIAIITMVLALGASLFAKEVLIEKYHVDRGESRRAYSDIHYSAIGYLNQLFSSMTNQLVNNKDFQDIKRPTIATTSFVNLKDFAMTNEVSNLLSENLTHEMQIRGFKVIDYKLMGNIKITPEGDFVFSRDVDQLKQKITVDYVLTGTYSSYKGGVLINARIIDMKTQIILSSAQILIPHYVMQHLNPYPKKIADFYPNVIELSK